MFNLWAVLSATIIAYLAGAVWYSPLFFLRRWCRETGTPSDMELPSPIRVYGLTFLATLICSVVMYKLLGPAPSLAEALTLALTLSVGIVATSLGINYQFARNSLVHWLIDSGFHCVRFLLIGVVLAVWPF